MFSGDKDERRLKNVMEMPSSRQIFARHEVTATPFLQRGIMFEDKRLVINLTPS